MNIIAYLSQFIIPLFLIAVILYGITQKVNVYASFIDGARQGPGVVLKIFPYLLAVFAVIKGFQASGAFELVQSAFSPVAAAFNVPFEVITMALVKPLSGSASTAVFTDIIKTTGPDSLATRISAVIMGSAETTFYVVAVYLGAVGITKSRYLLAVCILADIIGIVLAIALVQWMF